MKSFHWLRLLLSGHFRLSKHGIHCAPGIDPKAIMSSDKRATPLYFVPLQSSDMLPEERKKVVRKMHAAIHEAGLESVLIGKLPIDEEIKYADVPLETVPLINAMTEAEATAANVAQPTAKEVADSAAKRASLVASNLMNTDQQ